MSIIRDGLPFLVIPVFALREYREAGPSTRY